MSQIGVLHWMVKLGRADVIAEVSMLASQLLPPRDGHLEAVCRIFAHLDNELTPAWSLTQRTPRSTWAHSKSATGESFMAVSASLLGLTCLIPVARRLRLVCALILTMPVIN